MENNVKELRPTNMTDLQQYAKGSILELPAFGPNQPFVARVKRPSMLRLVETGKIPNSLLMAAQELFTGKATPRDDKGNILKETCEICTIFAKECLLEPTYDEIVDAGVELADNQLIALFNYAQDGVKSLTPFRTQQENPSGNLPGKNVSAPPQRNFGNKR